MEYSYDALGRRIEKRSENGTGTTKTRFIHDGVRVAEEWDIPATGSPSLEASYVYGNYVDEVLTMRRGGVDYYHHGDDMHNVVKLTDADGLVVEGYDYGDYGTPEFYDENGARTSATASEFGNPYLFTGREWDEELGYYYFRNRYMDPALGRFTSRDPLGLWGDAANLGNGYTYAASNPWSMVDPFGLASGGNQSAQQNAGVVDQIMGVIQNNWWDFLVGFVIDGAGGGIQAVWQLFRHPIQTWDALKATVTALVNDPGGFFGDIRDQMLASLTDPRALGALTFDALVTVTGVGAAYMGVSRVGKGLKLLNKLGGGRRDGPDIEKGKAPGRDLEYEIGDVLPDGRIVGHGPGTPSRMQGADIPGQNHFRGINGPDRAFRHLEQYHGLDPNVASNRLHRLKSMGGMGAADDVVIGRTGDVYNSLNGEFLGSLTDRGLGTSK